MNLTEMFLLNSPRIPLEQAVMSPGAAMLVSVLIVLGIFAVAVIIPIIVVECFFPTTDQDELDKQEVFQQSLLVGAEANKTYWKDTYKNMKNLLSSDLRCANILTTTIKRLHSRPS